MSDNSFDNTTIVLSFSRHKNAHGVYFRCIPDADIEVSLRLCDVHIIFDPELGELRISRNRNA